MSREDPIAKIAELKERVKNAHLGIGRVELKHEQAKEQLEEATKEAKSFPVDILDDVAFEAWIEKSSADIEELLSGVEKSLTKANEAINV